MSCRIAILGTRGIPNHYGGFEQLAEHLAPALVRAGHSVTVYNSHNHPFQGRCWEGVEIIHRFDPEFLLGSAGQFIYDLNCIIDARKRQFDIILQLGYTSSSIWGRLFPKGAVTIYNLDGLEWQRKKYSRLTRKFLLYAEKLAVKHGRHFIADSRVIQSYFKDKYRLKSEYIAYGASLFADAPVDKLIAYGVEPGEYHLVMARMEPENNIDMILEGFTNSWTRKKMLVIGNMSNAFSKVLKARFGCDDRIIFAGGIFDQAVLHSLKHHCQLYFHGHSTGGTNPSLLEAMASEALIAAHDNPFNREVLGNDALYFGTPKDISFLIGRDLPAGWRQMTQRNRAKIEEGFNWERIVEQYEYFMLTAWAGPGLAIKERNSNRMRNAAFPT